MNWWLIFGCFYSTIHIHVRCLYSVWTPVYRQTFGFCLLLIFFYRLIDVSLLFNPPQFNCFVWPPFWSILYHTRIYIYVITCSLKLSLIWVGFFCRRFFLVCSKLLSPYFWFVSLVTWRLDFNDLKTCNLQQYWLEEWKS